MKRRRHRAKSDILIDLTSLLDVIFIVLLVVMARQHVMTEKQAEQIEAGMSVEEAQTLEAEARAKYELFLDQTEMTDQLNQYVYAITVTSTYSEEDVTKRKIWFLKKGDAEPSEPIDLVGEDVSEAMQRFKNELEKYVQENEDYPVILSLNENDEKILYRDEKKIKDIFGELVATYTYVYIRYK